MNVGRNVRRRKKEHLAGHVPASPVGKDNLNCSVYTYGGSRNVCGNEFIYLFLEDDLLLRIYLI